MSNPQSSSIVRISLAGFLAWLIPGLGHLYLGLRARGLVCLVTVTATFWSGIAIGGVRSTVDPKSRKLWFVAQLCTAGNTLGALALHTVVNHQESRTGDTGSVTHWSAVDVGVHYTGVAGLLNLLIIFDALARAEPSASGTQVRRRPADAVP